MKADFSRIKIRDLFDFDFLLSAVQLSATTAGSRSLRRSSKRDRLRPSPSFKAITPTNTKATASPASGMGKIPRWRWSIPEENKLR